MVSGHPHSQFNAEWMVEEFIEHQDDKGSLTKRDRGDAEGQWGGGAEVDQVFLITIPQFVFLGTLGQ